MVEHLMNAKIVIENDCGRSLVLWKCECCDYMVGYEQLYLTIYRPFKKRKRNIDGFKMPFNGFFNCFIVIFFLYFRYS